MFQLFMVTTSFEIQGHTVRSYRRSLCHDEKRLSNQSVELLDKDPFNCCWRKTLLLYTISGQRGAVAAFHVQKKLDMRSSFLKIRIHCY